MKGVIVETKQVALVIVDISGYTQFIRSHKLSAVHAEEIVFELLEAVIDHADYPLTLNKLEGDAAFLYAELTDENQTEIARDVLKQAQEFFTVFYERARALSTERADCDCDACQRILDLKIKVVLHAGEAVFKTIRQSEEMAGEDVILVHHLLKNSIHSNEYILMTEAFRHLVGGQNDPSLEKRLESYGDLGEVAIHVAFPHRKTEPEPWPPIYFQFF
jgi:class 3 adenylate cyclase